MYTCNVCFLNSLNCEYSKNRALVNEGTNPPYCTSQISPYTSTTVWLDRIRIGHKTLTTMIKSVYGFVISGWPSVSNIRQVIVSFPDCL